MKFADLIVAVVLSGAPVSYAYGSLTEGALTDGFEGIEMLNLESTPVDQIYSGTYISAAGYFGPMKVVSWADEYNVSTCSRYGSNCVKTNFNLIHVSGNTFSGRGQLEARYDDVTCVYPVTVTVKAYSDRLFVRSAHPDVLYDSIVNNICPEIQSTEVVHREAYIIRN
jgi:hypothetical protein